jgi:protein CpxP
MRINTSTPETHVVPACSRRWRPWAVAAPLLAALALGGVSISAAQAQEPGPGMDPADAGAAGGFMARRMERMLDKVGATASQRSQIEAIWNGLRPQLKTLRQQHGAVRKQIVAALTAATVNASTVEQLRQQSMGLADKTSTLFTQGLVQTAQVLTPDQRKQVQAELAQEHGRFHHHGPAPAQP